MLQPNRLTSKLWKAVAEQGWLGAAIAEEHGGLGLGGVELCAIAEELGRALAPIPFRLDSLFCRRGAEVGGFGCDQKMPNGFRKLPLARSLVVLQQLNVRAFLTACGSPGSRRGRFSHRDENSGCGWRCRGSGGRPRERLVVARAFFSWTLIAPTRQSGGSADPRPDPRCQPSSRSRTPRQSCLARLDEGMALAEAVLNRAAVLLAFEQVGGADKALEAAKRLCVEPVRVRTADRKLSGDQT